MSEKRQWKAKQILATPEFAQATSSAREMLAGLRYCLIGGLAVGYHVNPPVTIDIDLLVLGTEAQIVAQLDRQPESEHWLRHRLWLPNKLRGLPRRGLHLIRKDGYEAEVDLLATGEDKFLRSVVEHAREVEVHQGLNFPVCTAEDIIIMKSLVGRDKDMDDISQLYRSKSNLDLEYINRQLEELE